MSRWIGLDVGTSSLKGLLVDEQGAALRRHTVTYPSRRKGPLAEQDARAWLHAAAVVLRELIVDGPPDGVAVVGQTPTLVPVGPDREPVGPAIIWQDTRPSAEAEELSAALGDPETVVGTRLPWSPAYLPAKLLWLARHAGSTVRRTRWLMQPKDLLAHALTGAAATDPWSSKGLCRTDTGAPVEPVFALAGLSSALLPPVRPAWDRLGSVDRTGATWSGLPSGTPVAVGWSDALSTILALGGFGGATAFVISGTSDIVGLTGSAGDATVPLLSIPPTCAPLAALYGPTQASGASIVWAADLLGANPHALVEAAEHADSGAVPRFVPYLDGERAPIWRADARALLAGLHITTGRPELVRGLMRGVALSGRHVLETALALATRRPAVVELAGHAALQRAWVRVRLECLGMDVRVHGEPDVTALGAAMLAATAARGESPAAVACAMQGSTTLMPASAEDRTAAAALYAAYVDDVAVALRH